MEAGYYSFMKQKVAFSVSAENYNKFIWFAGICGLSASQALELGIKRCLKIYTLPELNLKPTCTYNSEPFEKLIVGYVDSGLIRAFQLVRMSRQKSASFMLSLWIKKIADKISGKILGLKTRMSERSSEAIRRLGLVSMLSGIPRTEISLVILDDNSS